MINWCNFNRSSLLNDPEVDINNVVAQDGRTPLHHFCHSYQDFIEIVRLLIEKGADINAKASNGETPLHSLFQNGYEKTNVINIARLLIGKGADLKATTEDGRSLIHVCFDLTAATSFVDGGELVNLADFLVSNGADVNAKTEEKWTTLHFYLENNGMIDYLVVRYLIEKGADVKAKRKGGDTLLHVCCRPLSRTSKSWTDVCKLLIKKGANSKEMNNRGESPADTLRRFPQFNITDDNDDHMSMMI